MADALALALGVIERSTELIHEAVRMLLARETLDELALKELWERYGSASEAAPRAA